MKKTTKYLLALSAMQIGAGAALAADTTLSLDEPVNDSPNRIGASYRMGFNMGVRFKNIGGFSSASVPPGPAAGGLVNRDYADGFVHLDNNNNNYLGYPPATRSWGYSSESQVIVIPGEGEVSGPVYIEMHAVASSSSVTSKQTDDDPQPGFEINYRRELLRKKSWRAGFEAAFDYSDMSVDDASTYNAGVTMINDRFEVPADLGTGVRFVPPPGVQNGGAGSALILSTPIRSTVEIPSSANIAGRHRFGSELLGLRVGPYIEFPLSPKLSVGLSGGFAMAYVHSDLSFNETLAVPTVASSTASGHGSHEDWLPGGYVAGNVAYSIADNWAAVAGAQWMDVGQYTHTEFGREAVLDLRNSVFVTVGLSYSF